MFFPPYEYDQLNGLMNCYTPSAIHTCDNAAFMYWQRSLLQRIQSTFRINNIPDQWKGNVESFLDRLLIGLGYVVVGSDAAHGIYFSAAALSGYNMYYQPTRALLQNPELAGTELILNETGALIQLTPDYMGLFDVINYYAEQLALLNTSVNMSLINSKQPYLLAAHTKAAANVLKKMIDNVNEGNTMSVISSDVIKDQVTDGTSAIEQFKLFSADEYITDRLLADCEAILRQFNAEIGIPTPAEKKERMVTSEVDQQNIDSTARSRVWLECLESSCEKVNKLFGLNLQPELTMNSTQGGEMDEDNISDDGELPTAE